MIALWSVEVLHHEELACAVPLRPPRRALPSQVRALSPLPRRHAPQAGAEVVAIVAAAQYLPEAVVVALLADRLLLPRLLRTSPLLLAGVADVRTDVILILWKFWKRRRLQELEPFFFCSGITRLAVFRVLLAAVKKTEFRHIPPRR